MLPQADTGRNLARIRSVLARNAADGVTEDIANQVTKTVVGIDWMPYRRTGEESTANAAG